MLVGATEYRCCREVNCVIGVAVFDGTIENITCITQHHEYKTLVQPVVLTMVAPLLRDTRGRGYRQRAGHSKNE